MITLDHDPEANVQRRSSRLRPPGFWRAWLIGPPLPTAAAPHQTIGKAVGLAVFASDALSSTAYATQEIIIILAVAGTGALGYAFPISLAIVGLMAIVTLSYQQTVHAYPAAAAPTSWRAITWATCRPRLPGRPCSPITSSPWRCRSPPAWPRSPRPIPPSTLTAWTSRSASCCSSC